MQTAERREPTEVAHNIIANRAIWKPYGDHDAFMELTLQEGDSLLEGFTVREVFTQMEKLMPGLVGGWVPDSSCTQAQLLCSAEALNTCRRTFEKTNQAVASR